MSSTEFKADGRDIKFIINDVFHAEKLCELSEFSEFDSETFNLIIDESCAFAEKVLAPLNESGDKEGCHLENGEVVTPKGYKEAWKQMGENGWIGLNMPVEYGGQGTPELVSLAARESLFAANQAFYITPFLSRGAADLIAHFGSEEQKSVYCEKILSGEWAGTMDITEPNAGSAVGDISTTAVNMGDYYSIKGNKQFITGGDHNYADNIIHLVLARVQGAAPGPKGLSLFIIPKIRLDGTPNDVTVVNIEHKMGINGSSTCLLAYGENDQCHGYLLNAENEGMAQMFQMMNESRLQIGLQGLAAATAAYQFAHAYANERVQGIPIKHGKDQSATRAKIVEHPDVRRMLMTIKATTESLRGLIYACGYFVDMSTKGPDATKAYYKDLLDLHIPIAKAFATDQGIEMASLGVQVYGGVGYTKDFPVEQNLRDARIGSIYEGTNGIQALDLVTRKFFIKNGSLLEALKQELTYFQKIDSIPEEIRPMIQEWQDYHDQMFQSIEHMLTVRETQGPQAFVLYANNILALMGDVLCAFYLLKQAVVAQEKFNSILEKAGSPSKEQLVQDNPDAEYYWNKVKTADFYVYSLLPRVLGNARIIKNANTSPLDAQLTVE